MKNQKIEKQKCCNCGKGKVRNGAEDENETSKNYER